MADNLLPPTQGGWSFASGYSYTVTEFSQNTDSSNFIELTGANGNPPGHLVELYRVTVPVEEGHEYFYTGTSSNFTYSESGQTMTVTQEPRVDFLDAAGAVIEGGEYPYGSDSWEFTLTNNNGAASLRIIMRGIRVGSAPTYAAAPAWVGSNTHMLVDQTPAPEPTVSRYLRRCRRYPRGD